MRILRQRQMKQSKSILKNLPIRKRPTGMSLLKLRKPTLNHQPQMTPLMRQSLKRHTNRLTKRLSRQKRLARSVWKPRLPRLKKRLRLKFAKPKRKQAKKSALQRKKSSRLRMSAICSFVTTASAVLQLFLNMPKSLQNSASFQSQTSLWTLKSL